MMNIQCLAVSMILIVLSLVQINAAKYQSPRQTTNSQCPNVDLCKYVQCQNGICIEDKTSVDCFQCQCFAGFTGRLCEIPTASQSGCTSPCLNGGQCQQTATSTFVCDCPAEYTGDQCETSILATHPCVIMPSSVCQNGATCTINGAGYLCNCATGWTGANCETQDTVTTCDPNPCGAHGTCSQVVLPTSGLAVLCTCEAQWTGTYCDVSVATTPIAMTTTTEMFTTTSTSTGPTTGGCTPTSCLNGGSCFNTGNDFICVCKQGFSGRTCSVQNPITTPNPTTASTTNPCSPNPCNNGGSCYKHSTGFVCLCSNAYTGQTCDALKTTPTPSVTTPSTAITCANQPCQNGAVCYNAGSSYYCYCGTGSAYTGKNCETPIAAADPHCPLDCSPGYCVRTGGHTNTHVCMCNGGILTPNSCSKK